MKNSDIFDRPCPQSGKDITGEGLRTGNALVKRELLTLRDGPFDPALGRTGGSDSDLFQWLAPMGVKFVWSAEASVSEEIEEKRRYLRWHLRRAYRGGWTFSRQNCNQASWAGGLVRSLLPVVPSFLRSVGQAASKLPRLRLGAFVVMKNTAIHVGKVGYFFGLDLVEYRAS